MTRWVKISSVVVGAIVLSTLAIQASDLARGISSNLPGLAIESTGPCGKNAEIVHLGGRSVCIDTYEASPSRACPVATPGNEVDTQRNISDDTCAATSEKEVAPWRFVTHTQATQLCARSSKRLLTNEEWYKAVSGSTDLESCVISSSGPSLTGSTCKSPAGIYDMVGNVWEWVDGEVTDGEYDSKTLPRSGYVSLVDSDGIVLETSDTPSEEYNADYAWLNSSGVFGMIRGGFYGARSDAGMFALNASVQLNFSAAGVGFRCVKDIE